MVAVRQARSIRDHLTELQMRHANVKDELHQREVARSRGHLHLAPCEVASLEGEIAKLEARANAIGELSATHRPRYLWAIARHAFGIRDMRHEWKTHAGAL